MIRVVLGGPCERAAIFVSKSSVRARKTTLHLSPRMTFLLDLGPPVSRRRSLKTWPPDLASTSKGHASARGNRSPRSPGLDAVRGDLNLIGVCGPLQWSRQRFRALEPREAGIAICGEQRGPGSPVGERAKRERLNVYPFGPPPAMSEACAMYCSKFLMNRWAKSRAFASYSAGFFQVSRSLN
jgi:hypothetical protein